MSDAVAVVWVEESQLDDSTGFEFGTYEAGLHGSKLRKMIHERGCCNLALLSARGGCGEFDVCSPGKADDAGTGFIRC